MSNESFRRRVARWLDPTLGATDATLGPAMDPAMSRTMAPPAGPATHPGMNPNLGWPTGHHAGQNAGQSTGQAAGFPMGPSVGPATGPAMSPSVTNGTMPAPAMPRPPAETGTRKRDVWPEICERFALQMLGHAEHVRPALDQLEADEQDEERLKWLYQVDHSVTRMRRAVRDLRILAGVEDGELGGYTSSLVDVIRAAESSIEHYPKVVIARVVDLAVVPYASDDFSSLLAALLDNATNYSPSTVTVSAHLLDTGSVMMRVEDNGIGIPSAHLEVLNAALAGPVPEVNDRTGKHTGFPVVHRLARKHGVGVRLASRPGTGGSGGTIAMVTIPADLLCEVPDDEPAIGGPTEPVETMPEPAPAPYAGGGTPSHLSVARPSPFADEWRPPPPTSVPETLSVSGLPRRTRTSLRGEGGRPRGRGSEADTSASARSFADDLSAFTAGDQSGRPGERPVAGGRPPAGAEREQPEGERP